MFIHNIYFNDKRIHFFSFNYPVDFGCSRPFFYLII